VRWAKRTLRGLAALLAAVLAVLLLSHSASAAERTIGERERTSVVREVDGREGRDGFAQPDAISSEAVLALHHALPPGPARPQRDPAALTPTVLSAEERVGPPEPPVEPLRQSRSASPALLQVFRC